MATDFGKTIFMIVEPSYITPFWFSQSIKGLEDMVVKHKYTLAPVSSVGEADGSHALVIVGTNRNWLREVIQETRDRQLKPILVGAIPEKYGEDVSGTMYGGKTSIEEMLGYFAACGKKHIALVDINPNSSNDTTKYEAFLSTSEYLGLDVSSSDVYFKDSENNKKTEDFLENINDYDGCICSNDYAAAYVLSYAKDHGVRVPEDLFVAGLGDIMLCRYTDPSLTSATRSYYEAGQQVFNIWRNLYNNPDVESVTVSMKSEIKARGSTGRKAVPEKVYKEFAVPEIGVDRFVPPVTKGTEKIKVLQDCLSQCDFFDLKIIMGIINDESNEKLAENLEMASGTINYRLKKLYKNAGVASKSEFSRLIKKYLSVTSLDKRF